MKGNVILEMSSNHAQCSHTYAAATPLGPMAPSLAAEFETEKMPRATIR